MVVAVAMIGSVTVVPAVWPALGDRASTRAGSRSCRACAAHGRRRAAFWYVDPRRASCAARSCRPSPRPALLLALAFPALSMHTANTGIDDLPRKLEVMKVYDKMQAAFPGGQIPAVVVVKAEDVTLARGRSRRIADLKSRAIATGHMDEPIDVRTSTTTGPSRRSPIPVQGDGTDDASERAARRPARRHRARHVRRSQTGVEAYVTGMTAELQGLQRPDEGPRAASCSRFVLTLAFLLLLVTFRSIVIPIKAIVLNLLSVAAAYGVLDLGLPGRPRRGAAGLRVQRRGRRLAADVPVRDPLRPVDGLPRVHPQPGPRGRSTAA